MEKQCDSPRARRSARNSARSAPGTPAQSALATPSKVSPRKPVKKSPTSKGKGKNNPDDLTNDKARKLNDDAGEDTIKTEKDNEDLGEDGSRAVKEVQDSSQVILNDNNKDKDVCDVHTELIIKNDEELILDEDVKFGEDDEESGKVEIPDVDNISHFEAEIEGVPNLDDNTKIDLNIDAAVETPDNVMKPSSPPNDSDKIESESPIDIIDEENGEEDPSIVIPDDDNDEITLTYEDVPKNFSKLRPEFVELDRVGEVDDEVDNDDVVTIIDEDELALQDLENTSVTIIDEDEEALQELENIRSEGFGSERDDLLNTTVASSDIMDCVDDDYGFSDEEIELSGDEEEDDFHRQDVTMMLIKRPPLRTEIVECYDILDSDEEFPVCLAEGEKTDAVNIEKKYGVIKEYIEPSGLGMIYSKEFGLILFHLENVWINGEKFNPARTRSKLEVGSAVSFYDQTFKDEKYKDLSNDGVIHQAVAVWVGMRVDHLMKKTSSPEYQKRLKDQRDSFMVYLTHDVFMRVAKYRTKAKVTGYLTDEVGILEMREEGETKKVLFHTENVLIFRKPLNFYIEMSARQNGGHSTVNSKMLLPVGLNVSIDARRATISGFRDIEYQAIIVLAGSWHNSIHPTALPGGPGSTVPSNLEVPDNHTFYYFDIDLEGRLQQKVRDFHDILGATRGQLVYDYNNSIFIKGPQDHAEWKAQFTGVRPENQKRREPRNEEKEQVGHLFKAPPPRPPLVIKEFKEEENGSVAATAGSSYAGSVSGVGSAFSRPCSGLSMSSHSSGMSLASSRRSTVTSRNWYRHENWQFGGLRVKTEVKAELEDDDGPSPPKRIKSELGLF